ncbi:Serine aminopeptidase, S33 [Duganella sp. CF458]|uniref:alpha/beta hydrolase n=1 Tax=Duganella sp. CF458 TaxID=1884368 RepID=UPI0008EFC51E|nr:alpha/beta fold hydrolase [Duganella sp. CF458]SFF82058.1 Serine aminopeptidase, S33 [Duganella sp. CF458]
MRIFFCQFVAMLLVAGAAMAQPAPQAVGIVVMHGKGGSPTKFVAELASGLEAKGYQVANIEMPWSGSRNYDVSTAAAEAEINAALVRLRAKGATRLFLAGHSQGGTFAFYFGSRNPVDGLIAIAPGASSASQVVREKLGGTLEEARQLAAAGKGGVAARLQDFEGAKGTYTVVCKPDDYLTWFDPEGAMNLMKSIRGMKPETPVLLVVPKNDYPGLLKARQANFNALPRNPMTQLYEPDASHTGAPSASLEEVARWIMEVVKAPR